MSVSDILIAILVGIIVPVPIMLAPYAWMLLPRYREGEALKPEDYIEMGKSMTDGLIAGLKKPGAGR